MGQSRAKIGDVSSGRTGCLENGKGQLQKTPNNQLFNYIITVSGSPANFYMWVCLFSRTTKWWQLFLLVYHRRGVLKWIRFSCWFPFTTEKGYRPTNPFPLTTKKAGYPSLHKKRDPFTPQETLSVNTIWGKNAFLKKLQVQELRKCSSREVRIRVPDFVFRSQI